MTSQYQRHALLLIGMVLYWPGTFQEFCLILERWAYFRCNHSVSPDASQSSMLEAREKLLPLMKKSISGSSWRKDSKYYVLGKGPLGAVDLSPAWFQQGHDVSASVHELYSFDRWLISNQRISQQYPQASVSLRDSSALDWLDSISESNAVVSAILSVIHPKLYDAGRKTADLLRVTPQVGAQDILRRWASVFDGVSVISNRITKPHRDLGSRFNWYDILATSGTYEKCTLELPSLGISLEYGTGSVVGILGKVLTHEVRTFEGDRVCYAYFMRDKVHDWARVPCSDWMCISHYDSTYSDQT
jgi:hypothetical protein